MAEKKINLETCRYLEPGRPHFFDLWAGIKMTKIYQQKILNIYLFLYSQYILYTTSLYLQDTLFNLNKNLFGKTNEHK